MCRTSRVRSRYTQPFSNEGLNAGEHLVEGELGGVKNDGIGSGTQRGFNPVAVSLVAFAEFFAEGFGCDGGSWRLEVASLAAGLGGCVEEELDFGVGKDDGADVAAFHDDAALTAHGALQVNHPGSDGGMDADAGGSLGDGGLAQRGGNIDAVEEDAVAAGGWLELDGGGAGERLEVPGVVGVDAGVECLAGEGAVHGAGLKIEEAEVCGKMAGDGAFAGSGGSVNRDDGFSGGRGVGHQTWVALSRGGPFVCIGVAGSGGEPPGVMTPSGEVCLGLVWVLC